MGNYYLLTSSFCACIHFTFKSILKLFVGSTASFLSGTAHSTGLMSQINGMLSVVVVIIIHIVVVGRRWHKELRCGALLVGFVLQGQPCRFLKGVVDVLGILGGGFKMCQWPGGSHGKSLRGPATPVFGPFRRDQSILFLVVVFCWLVGLFVYLSSGSGIYGGVNLSRICREITDSDVDS